MIHNDLVLQNRIDKFLDRKRDEIPELDQSVDDIYRQLAQDVRRERHNHFTKVDFGDSIRERALPKVRHSHHYGGLHLVT